MINIENFDQLCREISEDFAEVINGGSGHHDQGKVQGYDFSQYDISNNILGNWWEKE